jgi:hypothetical protein
MTIPTGQVPLAPEVTPWYLLYLLPLAMVGLVLLIVSAVARRESG